MYSFLLEGGSKSGGGFRGDLNLSNEHRSRLTVATDRMAVSSDRLKESRKVAQETEMVAVDIMEDLRQQRETLLHARDSGDFLRLRRCVCERVSIYKPYI